MNDENKIYIVSDEKPIKIVFEGPTIEVLEDKCIFHIPVALLSDIKIGVICQDDFTPEQWTEIEKWTEEENKKIDMGED